MGEISLIGEDNSHKSAHLSGRVPFPIETQNRRSNEESISYLIVITILVSINVFCLLLCIGHGERVVMDAVATCGAA
jgi:hypothetical protein